MKCSLALLGWLALLALVLAQDCTNRDMHEMHRPPQDPKAYIAMLDDPKRDAYQKPHEVITALKLKEGEVIADNLGWDMVDQTLTFMGEPEEDIEDAEGGGWNGQEIHGHQIFGVVLEKGLPGLVAAPNSGAIRG